MRRLLLAGALGFTPGAAAAQTPELQVVKLPAGSAQIRSNDEVVTLLPGGSGFSIPAESQTTVVSGEIWAVLLDTLFKADVGDAFIFHSTDGRGQVFVSAGALEVTRPDGTAKTLAAGESYEVSSQPPAPPGAQAAPSVPQAGPEAPATPPGWDPLNALARSMSALAAFKRPEFKLVVEVHPFYRLSQTYESNIYLVPPDKPDGRRSGGGVLGSWITNNELGAKFLVPFNRRHKLDVDYGLEWISYSKQSRTNNAVNQRAGFSYTFAGLKDVVARASEKYVNTEDPAFSEQTARERRFQNTLSADVDVRRSRLFVWTLDAQHVVHKYLNPSLARLMNRYEASAGGSAGIRLQPKTRLYAAYHRGVIHYSAGRNASSRSHRVDLGVDGRLSPKLSGKVQAGAQFREYDASPVAGASKTANYLQTQVQLAFRPDKRNELTTRLFRDINESTFGNNRYYVSTGWGLGASHAYHRLTTTANGTFQVDRYPIEATTGGLTAVRRDDLYTAGLGLDMKVRPWLSWSLGYQRLQRHSIFTDQFNYADDRTTMSLRFVF